MSRTARLTGWVLLVLAVTAGRASRATTGTWSDFGPKMTHNQPQLAGGNPPIVVDRGFIFVSDRLGVNKMSLSTPTAWTYLINGTANNRIGRMVVNSLGNPLIGEKGKIVRVWNGSKFIESRFSPPAGSWYTLPAMAVDRSNGAIYATGNFSIYKSTDNGSSFGSIADLGTVCAGSNGDRRGWIYTIAATPWHELFIGGETDAIYSSFDGGSTWSSLPKFKKKGNRYALSPTKDGELLISTAASDTGDDYFVTYTSEGALVPATQGLAPYLMNDQQTVAGQVVLLDSGENFVVARYRNEPAVHCLKWDGKSWTPIESLPNGPGAELLSNSVGTDGAHLYVGTASGQIKKWTPAAKFPFRVATSFVQPAAPGAASPVTGTVSPAGDYAYRWSARGSKAVTFANASSLATTVTFSQPGDYALNLKATDGQGLTAGSTMLVHVASRKK